MKRSSGRLALERVTVRNLTAATLQRVVAGAAVLQDGDENAESEGRDSTGVYCVAKLVPGHGEKSKSCGFTPVLTAQH